ncbi:MAG: hypothetical protein WBE74_04605 [Terracidiphilus sp.]
MLFPASRFAFHRTALLAFLTLIPLACNGQNRDAVCRNGDGSFSAKSPDGVVVFVGNRKVEGFGSRDCQATLSWKDQQLTVVPHAWQLDVDAIDLDLGLGAPLLALQITPTDIDRTSTYQIYSLSQPPHLLREITGGDNYAAADTNLDGHVEIWTHDAQAIDGFENITLSSFDYPPTVVLRFEKRKLIDVSAEFTAEFDQQIAAVNARLTPEQLNAFKTSNGSLTGGLSAISNNLHQLIMTKKAVLEIVFAYLYSGREDQAGQTLRDLWPTADYDRTRAAIAAARSQGILRQVDGTESVTRRPEIKHQIVVYQAPPDQGKQANSPSADPSSMSLGDDGLMVGTSQAADQTIAYIADAALREIHLSLKASGDEGDAPLDKPVMVHLVIDEAGKVQSIRFDGAADPRIKKSTADWRFIPALKRGRPVACSLDYDISSLR